jgi:hypothetical protein
MEALLRDLLVSPNIEYAVTHIPWLWPVSEIVHFAGICLLVGVVGFFDLRLLGAARGLPVAPLKRLLPWGVVGFILCLTSGLVFVLGLRGNIPVHPYDVLMYDPYFQLKVLFIVLAGVNLLAFYVTGTSRAVDSVGAGEDAPPLAKVIAGISLGLWVSIILLGRWIPQGLELVPALE